MKIENNINSDVNRTLDSLKNLPELEPDSFVYTKVMAELESYNKENNNFKKEFGIILTLICFIVINSVSIYLISNENENIKISTEFEIQIAEEYYINYNTR